MTQPPNAARAARTGMGWLLALYFGSGACALIDEVVWVRLLKLTLGNTVYASSVVVSVFLGGLAAGALIMSRHADRLRDRLGWYAGLELVAAASALAVPFALRLADGLYVRYFQATDPAGPALLAAQVLVSAAIVLVPAICMGSTLPLLGRWVAAREDDAGRLVGRLYAWNTLGAATGCCLAGFVLVRALGVMGTLYFAAALNVLVVVAALALRRRAGGDRADAEAPRPERAAARPGFGWLLAAFFASGFVSIGYEIGWVRSVMFLLGGDTYVFASVLTVYLLGNVAGAAVGSRLAGRVRRPAAGFAITLGLLGAAGVAYLPSLIGWAGVAMAPLEELVAGLAAWAPVSTVMVTPLVQSASLFALPAFLMGVGFPLALQAWTARVHLVGRSTGAAYAANTLGAVLGGIVTGFGLLPRLGVQASMSLLGVTAAWIAAGLWLAATRGARPLGRLGVPALAAALSVAFALVPGGLLREVMERSPWLSDVLETLDVREGVTTTVTVHRNRRSGTLHLYASGQAIAGDTYALRGDQKALGHFGVLLHPAPRAVLSVGFGSGETTRCLSLHRLERIDCVEIAPEVVETALAHFRHLNLGERARETVNFVFMDAKNYLHLTDRRYDVIVNDSIHPRNFSENASLYGREYFEAARRRLEPGGLFVSWLPTYHMSTGLFDSILGTLGEVFPHVSVWYLTQHWAPLLVLVASDAPQRFDPRSIDAALEVPAVRESLAIIGIHDTTDLLNCYVADENDLRPRLVGYHRNSDYTPYVEFNTDPWNSIDEMFRRYVLELRADSVFEHIDLSGLDPAARAAWSESFRRRHRGGTYLLQASVLGHNELEQLLLYREALAASPDDPAVLRARDAADRDLLPKGQNILRDEGPNRALELAQTILGLHPRSVTAWILRSRVMLARGEPSKAMLAAQAALSVDPSSAAAQDNLRQVGEALRAAGGAVTRP